MLISELVEMLQIAFEYLKTFFQYLFLVIFFYYLTISAYAWRKKKEKPYISYKPKNKFAIVISAYNEEKVISHAVESLKKLKYPNELYDIYVVADNCTDKTAIIAEKAGAKVYERLDSEKRGKGYTLEWIFKKICSEDMDYDAVSVFDADNLVASNFLQVMNKHLCMGHDVVQGYLDSKNPSDTWISSNNSIAFWIGNRFIQLPRYYLGLSCYLGGTGFVISTKILKEFGWDATCLTEDLEFSIKLVLKGKKVYWAHDAVIYDEKPLSLKQSWKQRRRWMQGHFDCVQRFFLKLMVKAIKDKDRVALDAAVYLTQPLVISVNGLAIIAGFLIILFKILSLTVTFEFILMAIGIMFLLYLTVFFILIEGKVTKNIIKYIIAMPIYNLTWIPIIVLGIKDRNNKEWVHTIHTRAIEIDEIEKLEKVG